MAAHPNPLINGCPKCGGEQLCPCSNCAPRNVGKITWKWAGGEIIVCGHCGFAAHADYWQDVEISAWEYARQSEHHASFV